jgi:hypothetical protein
MLVILDENFMKHIYFPAWLSDVVAKTILHYDPVGDRDFQSRVMIHPYKAFKKALG